MLRTRSLAVSANLCCRCRYNDAIISVCKPYTDRTPLPADMRYYADRATSLTQQAMDDLKSLVHRIVATDYRCGYGYHYVSTVALAILSNRKAASSTGLPPQAYETVRICVRYLVHLGNFIYTSQIVLRAVQDAAETSDVPLNKELVDLFDAFDGDSWVKQASDHVWSAYPAGAKAKWRGEGARVDELLKHWERDMRLEEAEDANKET